MRAKQALFFAFVKEKRQARGVLTARRGDGKGDKCGGVNRDRNMCGTSSASRVSPSTSRLALAFARLKKAGKCVMFSNWKTN